MAGSFYFFYYAGMAALSPFPVLHYEQLGLDGEQIGLLTGIPPALILIGAAVSGDSLLLAHCHRRRPGALPGPPITPLVDNSVLGLLGDRRDRYGRIRIWGAIGWGAMGPVAAHFVESFGLSVSFKIYGVLFAICFLITLVLPIAHVKVPAFWTGLRALIGDPTWRLFLFFAFASGSGSPWSITISSSIWKGLARPVG